MQTTSPRGPLLILILGCMTALSPFAIDVLLIGSRVLRQQGRAV